MSGAASARLALLPPAVARYGFVFAALALAALIAGIHGRCITHGFFLDDHAHVRQLRACGWSLGELVSACRLELVGDCAEMWFLPECTLRFFRPVTFACMKLVYSLTGWNAAAQHVSSLVWHWIACVLLMSLCGQLTGQRRIGFGAAAMFAIHPGHVTTVQWIAAQTELMVTAFLLASLLCYGQWRGWFDLRRRADGEACRSWRWGCGAAVFFSLALGCRENAAAFPLLLLVCELAALRGPLLTMLAPQILMWSLAIAYVIVRSVLLGPQGLPPRPYVYSPLDPGFAVFAIDKACFYLLGQFLLVPCVPFGGLAYFVARPLLFYGLTSGVVLLALTISLLSRRRLGATLGPAWLLVMMGPVLPVFEAPHHLYLPGVGWAVTMALLFRFFADLMPAAWNARRLVCESLVWAGGAAVTSGLGFVAYFGGLAMDTAQRVEDQVATEVIDAPRKLKSGDTIYIGNLPIIAHYLRYIVEARTGLRDLRVVALTWSPRVLRVDSPTELVWIDARTVELRIKRDRYFGGPAGALVRAAGRDSVFREIGRPHTFGDTTVTALAADEDGIAALRIVLPTAVDGRDVHFYWGSSTSFACQLPPEATR